MQARCPKLMKPRGGLGWVQVLALPERTGPFSRLWKGLGRVLGGTIARGRGASRGAARVPVHQTTCVLAADGFLCFNGFVVTSALIFSSILRFSSDDELDTSITCAAPPNPVSNRPQSPSSAIGHLQVVDAVVASPRTGISAIFQLLQHHASNSVDVASMGRVMLHVPCKVTRVHLRAPTHTCPPQQTVYRYGDVSDNQARSPCN